MQKWGEMSVTVTILGSWEISVAYDVYIRNGSRTNIGVQTFKMRRYRILISNTICTLTHGKVREYKNYRCPRLHFGVFTRKATTELLKV